MGRPPRRRAGRRPRRRDPTRGHRRPPGAGAVPRRAHARLPADGQPAAPRLRRHRADAGGQPVRPRRQRVEHLRRVVGERCRGHRRREPGAWLAGRAGRLPADGAGGCFVSGGSAANLSALVTARHRARKQLATRPAGRWRFATTGETHASVHAAARGDGRRRRARAAGRARADDRRRAAGDAGRDRAPTGCSPSSPTAAPPTPAPSTSSTPPPTSAPSSACGCTSTAPTAGPSLCAPSTARRPAGLRAGRQLRHRSAQVAVRAVRLRRPRVPRPADGVGRPRPARDVPRHGEPGGVEPERLRLPPLPPGPRPAAVVQRGDLRHRRLHGGRRDDAATWPAPSPARSTGADGFTLLLEPELSVVLFRVDGWDDARYAAWSTSRAKAGVALIVPTTWQGETCYRVCLVNPLTTVEHARRPPRRHARLRVIRVLHASECQTSISTSSTRTASNTRIRTARSGCRVGVRRGPGRRRRA